MSHSTLLGWLALDTRVEVDLSSKGEKKKIKVTEWQCDHSWRGSRGKAEGRNISCSMGFGSRPDSWGVDFEKKFSKNRKSIQYKKSPDKIQSSGCPLHCSCLENPRDREAWWAVVYGVAQSQIWLKQLGRTVNYIQYTVITYNGTESEKEYIGLTESLCCYLKVIHCI